MYELTEERKKEIERTIEFDEDPELDLQYFMDQLFTDYDYDYDEKYERESEEPDPEELMIGITSTLYIVQLGQNGDFRQTDPFISLQIDPLELSTVL